MLACYNLDLERRRVEATLTAPLQHYISRELTHFVGRKLIGQEEEQYRLLLKVINDKALRPSGGLWMGGVKITPNCKFSQNEMFSPLAICFCDIPVQYLAIHIKKYGPFGLSFDKNYVCGNGGCPVFYVPILAKAENPCTYGQSEGAPGSSKSKGEYFDYEIGLYRKRIDAFMDLVAQKGTLPDPHGLIELCMFLDLDVFSYVKAFNHTLPDEDPDNYYFEREWRVMGQMQFGIGDIRRIIIPEAYAKRVREDLPEYCGQVAFAEYG